MTDQGNSQPAAPNSARGGNPHRAYRAAFALSLTALLIALLAGFGFSVKNS